MCKLYSIDRFGLVNTCRCAAAMSMTCPISRYITRHGPARLCVTMPVLCMLYMCVSAHTHSRCVHIFLLFSPLSFTHSNRNSSMLHQLVNNAILVNKSRERGLMETYPETEKQKRKQNKIKKRHRRNSFIVVVGWYASQLKEQRTWAQLFLINSALFSSILIIPEQHIITTTLREPENKSRIVLNIYNKVDISVNMLKCLYLSLYKVSKPQRPNHQNKSYKKGKWTGTYKQSGFLLQASSTHAHVHPSKLFSAWALITWHSHVVLLGATGGLVLCPQACRLKEPRIKLPTFWLVDGPLCLLTHIYRRHYGLMVSECSISFHLRPT